MINLSKEHFTEFYPDLAHLYERYSKPPVFKSKKEFEAKYLTSKLWRINNIYTIINKDGNAVTFEMNFAQHQVYSASRIHPRLIILKSRQQGISTLWLVSYFDDAAFKKNMNLGLMAQGSDEAATLLERTKFLWDKLSDNVKAFTGVKLNKDNSKEFSFTNDSKIFIRVSFRSATLQRLHISEFGKIANQFPKRARETKTGTLQALGKGNTGIIESTAEGVNDFKDMWDKAEVAALGELTAKDFKPVFLPWYKDPDCVEPILQVVDEDAAAYFKKTEETTGAKLTVRQRNFWISQRRELEGDIFQEYPATPAEAFSASKNGSYWSTKFAELVVGRGRVVKGLYDPNLDVDIFFDLGVDDYMVMGFAQWWRGEYHIIDEYWNNGYGLEHYVDEAKERGYPIRSLRLPHDIEVRELMTGKGGRAETRADLLRKMLRKKKLPWKVLTMKKGSIADSIESVRGMLGDLWIDSRCTYLIECFHKYSKEWDDKLQVWKKTPRHDEWSHGADVIRSIATDTRKTDNTDKRSKRSNAGYDL